MWKWIVGSILVLILIFFGVVYQFFGLKEFFQFRKYLAKLPGEGESVGTTSIFFRGANGNMVGGVVAYIGSKSLWLWGEDYLKRYRYREGVEFLYMHGCTPNGLGLNGFVGDENTDGFRIDRYTDVSEWRKKVEVGMHVYLVNNKGVVIADPDVKTTNDPLIFCSQNI